MIERYCEVRATTERLASVLSAEDQTIQSMPDASPTKWHRAHTTWFFETFLLVPYAPAYAVFHERYGYLFNSYYDAVGDRHPRPRRGMLSRPSTDEVSRYRRYVDRELLDFVECGLPSALAPLVELGLHHEQQHQELLLMDVKHVLSVNPLRPAYCDGAPPPSPVHPHPGWEAHPGGVVEIGHPGDGFAFDNEGPRHPVLLQSFEIARSLVTNAEWLEFVADGGYARPELWMSDGWALVQAEQWTAPLYWELVDREMHEFTFHGSAPLDPAAPVAHVSWYEADAFARWRGCRLPTEAEWETVAPAPSRVASSQPDLHPCGADGGEQWYGARWQWTVSPYLAYPGFRPAPGAVGEYNGKFMVNQHVLRGSACITPAGHERRTYRNFFPPHARWACTGVRLARDAR